jgi:hypothetical protein
LVVTMAAVPPLQHPRATVETAAVSSLRHPRGAVALRPVAVEAAMIPSAVVAMAAVPSLRRPQVSQAEASTMLLMAAVEVPPL